MVGIACTCSSTSSFIRMSRYINYQGRFACTQVLSALEHLVATRQVPPTQRQLHSVVCVVQRVCAGCVGVLLLCLLCALLFCLLSLHAPVWTGMLHGTRPHISRIAQSITRQPIECICRKHKLPDVNYSCSKPLCAGTRWARWCPSARRCWWACWSGRRRARQQQTCVRAHCCCLRAGRAWCCTARCVRTLLLEPGV